MSSVSEYRKKLIEQYSGKSSKKKDDEEEKKSNISSTDTSSTQTVKPYKKSAYREELLKKYTTDKIKSTDVDEWFDNVSSVFKDMEADNTQDYSGRIKNLLNSSKDVYNYLQNNKDYLEDFDLWDKAFSQNRSALRSMDKWYYDKNYELSKIDNMSVDEIRAKIEASETVGDVLQNATKALEARKKGTPDKELEKDLDYVVKKYGLNPDTVKESDILRIYTNVGEDLKPIDLDVETPESSIAYYDPDGTAVSWKNLLRIKSTEERMSKMENSPEVKAAYDELVEYRDDIKRLENAQFAISAKAEGIAPDSEYEKDLEYAIEKYGLDPTLDMKQPIYEIYMQLVDGSYSGMEEQKAVLESAGYDWDEFEAYKKYFEDKEREKELQKSYRMVAEDYPVLATVFSIASAPGQIWDYAKDLVYMAQNADAADDSFRGMTNVYDNGATNFVGTVTSSVANKIDKDVTEATGQEWVGWLASSAYSGGTSALQSALTTTVCVGLFGAAGSTISLGLQGSQAAASSFSSAIKNGSTNGEALATSIASGVAEGLFEKVSLDHFLKISKGYDVTTLSGLFKSIAKDSKNLVLQGLVESSEEMFTEMANNLADDIINGDHSGYNAAVAQYKSKGYSEEEAKKMATIDYATNILSAAVGGFIGGVSSGSVAVGTNAIKGTGAYINYQNETVKPHGSALIKQGSKDSLMKFARETAKTDSKLNKYIDKVTKKASAKNVGTLSLKVEQSLSKQNLSDITKRFEGKGIETKDAQKFAGYVNKMLHGEELTQEDKAELRKLRDGEAQIKSALADIVSDPESPINIREADLMLARFGYKGKVTDELTKSSTAKVTETKDAIESGDIAVSEDGKAKILSSDETVTIDKNNAIARIENVDGNTVVYYNTSKGEVEASDISYASESDALLYEAFTDLSPSVASSLIRSYANIENNPVPVSAYVEGMREGILFYGKYGFREVGKDILEDSVFAKLPKQYQSAALNIGREKAKNETKTKQDNINSGATKTNDNSKGRVYFENGAKIGRSENAKISVASQKRAVSLAKHIASAIGINIAFYDSTISGTVNSDANGWFDRETDTIHLDLQKAASDKHTIAFTLSHEIVHFIEKWSPEKYKVLADFLMDQYAKHDVKTEVLLQNKMAALDTTDVDFAYREMVADAMESMLLDSNATVKLMELRQKDAGLFNKLKAHILELINKIRNEYKNRGYEPTSEEGKAVRAMEDSLTQFHKLFEEALVGATESYQNAETKTDKSSDDRVQKQAKKRFVEDKYYARQIDKFESLEQGGYISVGEIIQGSPLNQVGIPEGTLYFDVSKIVKEMKLRNDIISPDKMKDIPKVLDNPIVITEYVDKKGVHSANVYGNLYIGSSPVVVGVMIAKTPKGNVVSKVQTVHPNRNFMREMTDDNILYLSENKKETKSWFQSLGTQKLPLGGNKFGFIRIISQQEDSVKQFQKKVTAEQDADYLGAVNRGDKEAAQRMVEEAAKEAGYTVKGYHGTRSKFTTFRTESSMAVGGKVPIFLSADMDTASSYGGNVMPLYVKADNLFTFDGGGMAANNMVIGNKLTKEQIAIIEEAWGYKLDHVTTDQVAYAIRKEGKYDGVKFTWVKDSYYDNHMTTVYAVFDGNQVKSADPVTYDDSGDVIPLSERFNAENNDIRYQKKVTSNRELLSNALETTAQNDDEKKMLTRYKEQIDLLNVEEQKLRELRGQIKDLSFAKGKRDTKKIMELQTQANNSATLINKYDRELLKLESAKVLKDVLEREKAMVRKRMEEKGRELKTKAVQKKTESIYRKREKDKLQKLILDTARWLKAPRKEEVKCPDFLKVPFADFLESIDMSSKRLLDKGIATRNDFKIASAMDSLATAIEKIKKSQNPNEKSDGDSYFDSGYLDLPDNFVENIRLTAEEIKSLIESSSNDGLDVMQEMSSQEMKELTKIIKTLKKAIADMQTLYTNYRYANIMELGRAEVEYLDSLGAANNQNTVKDFVKWDNGLPFYVFKRFGVAGESIFESLMDSQDKLAFLADEIFKFKENNWSDEEVKSWSKDVHTIELTGGKKITLTTADAMGFYCLYQRELSLGGFVNHLFSGGIKVVDESVDKSKGDKVTETHLTQADVSKIIESLDKRQIEVADKIQNFMSTECAKWGNEIFYKRFLTNMFTEQKYYPIESNPQGMDYKDPSAQQSDMFRLLNISATKPLTKGANNQIIIKNIFNVFAAHTSDMAKLNAYGMALLDYMKWVNYKEKTTDASTGQITVKGIRKSLDTAFGEAAFKYVTNLIKDVNGRGNIGDENAFVMEMIRRSKVAAVGSNLRVALLQPTALPRAMVVLRRRSILYGLKGLAHPKKSIEMAKKYCGIALWKSFGFYDTNITRGVEQQIKGGEKANGKLVEASMKFAELGDSLTWGCLWNACEFEVAKSKEHKIGTEEFYRAVGKKLREVVYSSQVVDSVLTRSQLMRKKGGVTQMATSYMGEPTLSYNILLDAESQFSNAKRSTGSSKAAWAKTGSLVKKAVTAYMTTQILAAVVEALADAFRDDEEKPFGEKFLDAAWQNLLSDLMPLNKIPVLNDIVSLVMSKFGVGYFSTSDMSTDYLNTLSKAWDAWADIIKNGDEADKTLYYAIFNSTKFASQFTGLPISNAMREVVTIWNNTAGNADYTLKLRSYEPGSSVNAENLYQAIVSGDKDRVAKLEKLFGTDKDRQTALKSVIGNKYKEGKLDSDAASKLLSEQIGMDDDEVYWQLDRWDYAKENDTSDGYAKYDDFYSAVESGKNLKAVIKQYTDNGVEKKTLSSQITKYFKPLYIEMSKSERANLKGYLLNAYVQLGYDRKEKSKDIDKWLED